MPMLHQRHPKELRALQDREPRMRDMRLAVDSMEMSGEPLADRLAGLRNRLQPVLERRGAHLQWKVWVSEDMALPVGGPATDIFCILQETLSHVLEHSEATQVTVTMVPVPGQGGWRFEVGDNGAGWAAAAEASGTGLAQGLLDMQERARRAGLRWVCDAFASNATRVCLEAPAHGFLPKIG